MTKKTFKSIDELDKKMKPELLKQAKENAKASRVTDQSKKIGEKFLEIKSIEPFNHRDD